MYCSKVSLTKVLQYSTIDFKLIISHTVKKEALHFDQSDKLFEQAVMTMIRSVAILATLVIGASGTFTFESFTASQCKIPLNPPVILKFTPDPTSAPTSAPTRAPTRAPTKVPP
jgi:hypothetical protein